MTSLPSLVTLNFKFKDWGSMPPVLVKAHQQLDKAVDLCYRAAAFSTELSRLEYLFEEYRRLTEPVLVVDAVAKPKRGGQKAAKLQNAD